MRERILLNPKDPLALESFRRRLTAAAGSWGGDRRTTFEMELIVEELYTNYLKYAALDKTQPVEVLLELLNGKWHLTFKDNGAPFNPLEVRPPDVSLPMEERTAGGLGLYLVRHYTDRCSYAREKGWNILRMEKTQHKETS